MRRRLSRFALAALLWIPALGLSAESRMEKVLSLSLPEGASTSGATWARSP